MVKMLMYPSSVPAFEQNNFIVTEKLKTEAEIKALTASNIFSLLTAIHQHDPDVTDTSY